MMIGMYTWFWSRTKKKSLWLAFGDTCHPRQVDPAKSSLVVPMTIPLCFPAWSLALWETACPGLFSWEKDPDSTSPSVCAARRRTFHHYSDRFCLMEWATKYYNSFLFKALRHRHNEVINYMRVHTARFQGREKDDFHLILPQWNKDGNISPPLCQ